MNNQITLAYADDHKMIRAALCELLGSEPEFDVIGDFDNGAELIEFLEKQAVDIILLDIDMPVKDGFETMNDILEENPEQKIVIVSMHMDDAFIAKFMNNGARAFIPKSYTIDQFKETILAVYENGIYLDDRVSHVVVNNIIQSKKFRLFFSENKLSKREIEIIKLICEENTAKEIGQKLCIEQKTVEGHKARIIKKLNVKSAVGIVVYAIEKGIYTPKGA